MASEAEICNLALFKYGDRSISSLNDDTKEARACKVLYPLMRDEILYAHNWNFAMRRADISAQLSTAPAFGYDYAYTLPPECLRVWELSDLGGDTNSSRIWYSQGQLDKTNVVPEDLWEVEGNLLLTDREEEIYIRYIERVTEAGYFNPMFVNAAATRLAAELAVKLAEDSSMRLALLEELEKVVLPEARRLNALEGNKRRHRDSQPLDEGNFSWQAR